LCGVWFRPNEALVAAAVARAVRIGFLHYYNTAADVDALLAALESIAAS
jgi:selenocysteine lyase/cysteine desulfurase